MLWIVSIVPILAGISVYLAPQVRREWLAVGATIVLGLTAVLALAAAANGWRAALVWSGMLNLTAVLTPLSAMVAVLVPVVALAVLIFAAGHESRRGLGRLIGFLLAFVGAMELLVIADDLLTVLIGWELVGACSWALIGHHWWDAANPRAGLYAFIVTRLGDLGLFLAAMAMFAGTGTFAFADLAQLDGPWLGVVAAGVLVSAAAKSGQVPFSPWLFRAMAGPSSVSALLHAATMVAAGAYLLSRLQPALVGVGWFGPAVMGVGLVTALMGGVTAILQAHTKKLLAASTSAHFGLMFVAVGAGYPAIAGLHLVAHAFFKAQLFLAVGVAGERAGTFDLRRMRVGANLPLLAGLTAVGSLALAGLPPLGAGWTKEAVVMAAGHAEPLSMVPVLVAGSLSAAYAARFQLLAFGLHRESDRPQSVSGNRLLTIAIVVLATVTLLLSAIWLPGVREAAAASLGANFPEAPRWERFASLLAVAGGLYAGRLLAQREASLASEPVAAAVAEWWGLPVLIDALVTQPLCRVAQLAAVLDDKAIDALAEGVAAGARRLAGIGGKFGEWLADGLPEGVGRLTEFGGVDTQRLQTGLSHHYYAMVAVVALVLLGMLIAWV